MFGAFTIQSQQDFSLSDKRGFSELPGLVSQLKRAGGSRGLNRSKKVYIPKGYTQSKLGLQSNQFTL